MLLANFVLFLLGSLASADENHLKPVSDDEATAYLAEFGYAEAGKLMGHCGKGEECEEAEGDTESILQKAIKKFQRFAKLPETGVLDVKTKKKMAVPRCGIQDVEELNLPGAEKPIWKKSVVTYKFQNFSPQLPQAKIKEAVKRAYDTWAAIMPVKFQETSGKADITIAFGAKAHGDPWPFDGRGKVLAHATAPTDGKLHFDEDERWTIGPENPRKLVNQEFTDFFPVVLHEGGHTLGLKHSDDPDAIMAPFAHEWVDAAGQYITPKLKSNDIKMIQELYGKGSTSSPSSSNTASRQTSGTNSGKTTSSTSGSSSKPTTNLGGTGRNPSQKGSKGPLNLVENLFSKWFSN